MSYQNNYGVTLEQAPNRQVISCRQNMGAPYEIYITSHFDKIPVEQWETKIFFPINA
ncbi:MAG: hypothetical protein PUF72_00630 [Clostridiales bacterium]|nr:hypothetical protein [Clostridiales bacterium]